MKLQGTAELTFDYQHEIINLLDGGFSQSWGGIGVDNKPAISEPKAGDIYSVMLQALQQGEHYFQVLPGSDLPFIGIVDRKYLRNPAAPEHDPGFREHMIQHIGPHPIQIVKPMSEPLIVPPITRFIYGDDYFRALYNLGGEGDSGLLDASDNAKQTAYASFKVSIGIDPVLNKRRVIPSLGIIRVTMPGVHGPVTPDGTVRYVRFPVLLTSHQRPYLVGELAGTATYGTGTTASLYIRPVDRAGNSTYGAAIWNFLTTLNKNCAAVSTNGNITRMQIEYTLKGTTGTAPVQVTISPHNAVLQNGWGY